MIVRVAQNASWLRLLLTLLALLGAPAMAAAQEAGESPGMRREVFEYPVDGRRDPFEPLSAGDELGPRFEDLRLAGVIFSPERGSVAVLVDQATRRRSRAVRTGRPSTIPDR